jgi:hypothetical protein
VPPDPKTAAAAELQAIIARAEAAKRAGDDEARNDALTELNDFRTTPFADLRALAKEAHTALNDADRVAALNALGSVAARLEPTIALLDAAAATAAAGKDKLLFPKAAQKAEAALDKVVKLKQEFEVLKQTLKDEAQKAGAAVEGIQELKDIPEALDKLKAALQKLKDRAGGSSA